MFEHLFSPIKIKSMELKSRAIMPAMGTKFSGNASFVTPTLIEYHKARVRGGMKRTAGRPRSQIDHNLKGKRTVEIITEETGESPKQVQRYITLTNLIPELLQQLDDELISFNPAVELAALKELIEAMDYAQSVPSLSGTKDEETE